MSETKTIPYQTKYSRKRSPVSHEGKCQTSYCIAMREKNRMLNKDKYKNNRYCSYCSTIVELEDLYCGCCGFKTRGSRRMKHNGKEVKAIE